MAVSAYLNFTDSSGSSQDSIKVLNVDFGFAQNTDSTGKPSGRPLINNINVMVETTDDTQIVDWMTSFGGTKDGKIEIMLKNNIRKTIAFKNAYCVQYHESFDAHGDETPMHISFTISPESVEVDESVFISNI